MGVEKFKRKVLTHQHNWPDNRGVVQGVWDYDNTLTAQSILADTWTKLNNNGLGPQTNKEFAHPYASEVFNTTTNQFDFTSLEIGDTLDFRLSLQVTTTVNNQIFRLSGFAGIGVSEYEVSIIPEQQFKNHGTYLVTGLSTFYLGNTLTRDNPGELRFYTDDAATVTVDGWYIRSFALKRF